MSGEKRTATSTDAVHAGDPKAKAFDALPQPIVQTATYAFADTQAIADYVAGSREAREEYGRYGNPTARAVELRMAALEGTEDALLFPSGMAAITMTMLALLKAGQHVVLFADCYRMTREFTAKTLARFGVRATLLDAGDLDGLERAIGPETRLVVGESPTNPYLSCVDLEKVARIAKAHRAVRTIIDATFATPYNVRPASFGVDLVVHSATKYLAGHNDVLAGVVCGSRDIVSIVRELRGVLGTIADPHAAFLVARGLKTLGVRVERQNATGLAVARWLEQHPAVERVFYPGLPSHPDHAVAAAQMRGFGGVVSFVAKGGLDGARRAVDRMKLATIGPSLGAVETLVEPPVLMSYYELSPEERAEMKLHDGLVRLALGIEDVEDLLRDLDEALRP